MGKADNMFEELGYKKEAALGFIKYQKGSKIVSFYLEYEEYEVYEADNMQELNVLEHKAIHQKLKELGWLNE